MSAIQQKREEIHAWVKRWQDHCCIGEITVSRFFVVLMTGLWYMGGDTSVGLDIICHVTEERRKEEINRTGISDIPRICYVGPAFLT